MDAGERRQRKAPTLRRRFPLVDDALATVPQVPHGADREAHGIRAVAETGHQPLPILTPAPIGPVELEQEVGQPGQARVQATLLGRLNDIYGVRGGERPAGSYAGNPGFIMK